MVCGADDGTKAGRAWLDGVDGPCRKRSTGRGALAYEGPTIEPVELLRAKVAMSLELISRITERADADERLMVCLVSATRGSTPQKAGAIMLVGPDGRIEGTIGRGCVEAEERSRALQQLVKILYEV